MRPVIDFSQVSILVEYGWDFWSAAVPPLVLKLGRTKWFQPRKESGLTRHFQADEMNRKPARNVWLWEFDFILVWNEFLFVQICRQRGFIYHPAFVRGKWRVTDRKIEAFATKRTLLYGQPGSWCRLMFNASYCELLSLWRDLCKRQVGNCLEDIAAKTQKRLQHWPQVSSSTSL